MVLQHAVRSHAVHSPVPALSMHPARDDAHRPDPVRITGIAGALVLNAAALMLMLAPLGQPGPPATRPPALQGEWFEPRPLPPPPPPPAIVPLRPEVPPPSAVAPPRPAGVPTPAQQLAPAVAPAITTVDVPSYEPATDTTSRETTTGPVGGMQLAYAEASLPPYPPAALRAGYQGTVVLRVLVDVDGRPLRVEVETGSGYRELDDAARRHVLRRWRFQPAMRDGQAAQAIGLVPITFDLDRG